MNIEFIGATGTVTGSKYLLTYDNHKLLVDCGLFQGLKQLRLRNWTRLPFRPSEIKSLLLTHAHIDHSGYIPLLVKNGFKGKIYCSEGTAELCKILLPDSGYLQEEDAYFANKHGFSKHKPALPLYTEKDAENSLKQLYPIDFHKEISLEGGLRFTFLPAGHILGASIIRIQHAETTLVFTGDLGRSQDLIMKPPTPITKADYLVIESTYGDRLHDEHDPKEQIAEVVNRTIHRGGVLVIPSFAVGRAQTILYILYQLKNEKKIPNVPVYLDSPMARDTTELYCQFASEHRLSQESCSLMSRAATIINTPEESKELDHEPGPKVIITASGMATGGRVVHHLNAFITDPKNAVLFVGYQAAGTRGEALIHGAESVKFQGEYHPVRAEIIHMDSLSAHPDYNEILEWLRHFQSPPKTTFITHGEPIQANALRLRIQDQLGWNCHIPDYLERVELS